MWSVKFHDYNEIRRVQGGEYGGYRTLSVVWSTGVVTRGVVRCGRYELYMD